MLSPSSPPKKNSAVADFYFLSVRYVYHKLIHADTSDLSESLAAYDYSASGIRTLKSVGISRRDCGNPHVTLSSEHRAVAYLFACLYLVDVGNG